MKAVVLHEFGGSDRLRYEEIEPPKILPGEVLIQVKACGVNYIDFLVRKGILQVPLPHILGVDSAGLVENAGDSEGLKKGERVLVNPRISCGRCQYCLMGDEGLCSSYKLMGVRTHGGYAEYVKAPQENVLPIPENLSFEQAAAIPGVFVAAWHMLLARGRLSVGEDVLIVGATGAIGTAAIQIAKLCGARVLAVGRSDEKLAMARKLGADEIIDSSKENFEESAKIITSGKGVDVVVDIVGETTLRQSLNSLAKNGRLVTCGFTAGFLTEVDIRQIYLNQLSIIGSTGGNRSELLKILELVKEAKMKPVIFKALPLKDASEAHETMENGENLGKVVLIPS
jgi:NADPH:quinone reductase-like Zn-dependent oxidoreductase